MHLFRRRDEVASFHSWVAVRVAGDCARLLYFRRPSGEVPVDVCSVVVREWNTP